MLQQVVPPESSTGHQGSQCSSEKKPLQIFTATCCKTFEKYQSTKTSMGGEKGQGSDAHAVCQYLEPSLQSEWCKKIICYPIPDEKHARGYLCASQPYLPHGIYWEIWNQ